MTFDASQSLRFAMDWGGLTIPSILGVAPYAVHLITIHNDQINFNETDALRTVTDHRITVADGYRSYAALDGYLNPIVRQMQGEQLVLSNGQLTNNLLMLGPVVFPYTWNNFSGGVDPTLFQPSQGSDSNKNVYVQLRGVGLSPQGNFFSVKEMVIKNMGGLSYKLLLQATVDTPQLT